MNSRTAAFEFIRFSTNTIRLNTSVREGETKIGQVIENDELSSAHRFLILGISEDIGPQANNGLPGASTGFQAFLKRFLNIQSNEFLTGESIYIAGEIIANYDFQDSDEGRLKIVELDEFVENVLKKYLDKQPDLIPVIIGGGHNNAYPLIKTLSEKKQNALNVVNLDPHADYRPLEGRHSGNAFSYAKEDGFLNNYAVIGLHQSYNSQYILDQLKKNHYWYSFFEEYISGKKTFENDLKEVLSYVNDRIYGIELDIDAIKDMPSSAMTPSGFTVEEARKYIQRMSTSSNVSYLHLPEAAPKTERDMVLVGKTLGYLVADFIKTIQK